MTLDLAATLDAAASGTVATLSARDLVHVSGPDAQSFLQGQLTQDLTGLVPGVTLESLLLSPQGKLDAYLRIIALGNETFALDVDAGFGEGVLERLRRFKLRVKVDLALETVSYLCLRGPGAQQAVVSERSGDRPIFDYAWPGLVGVDVGGFETMPAGPFEHADPGALEVLRIRAGQPVMGAELTEKTIPQETNLTTRTVNFTKGCFTGQELVARLDARGGNVARHLRLLVVAPGERHTVPYVGEPILVEGEEVGTITSTAYSPPDNCSYALGYVHRRVTVPSDATVLAAGGEDQLATEILDLPAEQLGPARQ